MTEDHGHIQAAQADGRPQPASQSMSEQTALYYQQLTKGQLVAFRHADGCWYLYAPHPVEVDAQPADERAAVVGRRW